MLISFRLEIVLFLAQKLLWTHPIEHLGDLGHVESHFGPFGESLSIGAR
jgi:hypothetical protein